MKINYAIVVLLLAIGLPGVVSSCSVEGNTTSRKSTDTKTRWLKGEPCAPPCWENIRPGVTSSEEAVKFVKANPNIDHASIEVTKISDFDFGAIVWKFSSSASYGEGKVSYHLEQEVVDSISLTIPDLCLHEIINAYGEPDYLLLHEAYKSLGVVILMWQSQGFTYDAKLESPGGTITKDTCNGTLIQFPVGTSCQDIQSVYLVSGSDDDCVPWSGYGRYSN